MRKYWIYIIIIISAPAFSQNIDINLLKSINSPHIGPPDNFFRFMSNSAVFVEIGVPLGIGIAGYVKPNELTFRNACALAASDVVAEGVTYVLKYAVNRKRPFVTYPFITKKSDAGDPSFPSGHTSGAFATATMLSLTYPKWYIIAPSFVWAGTVAYSRMYLGVHYPSDVLGGMIVGAGCAYLTFKINQRLNIRLTKKYDFQ
jgi:membrane-associated phospholipid phosphatase